MTDCSLSGAVAFSSAKFGTGSGRIQYRNFACSGSESGLKYCSKSSAGSYCRHSQDAGIRCQGLLLVTHHPLSYIL